MVKKSWREKLENPPKGLPKVVKDSSKRFGGERLLIPTPLLVDKVLSKVPK